MAKVRPVGGNDGVHRAVLRVDHPRAGVPPVHGRVHRDEVAVGDRVVDLVVQVGEGGPQPQGGRVEPVGAGDPRRRRLDPVLVVDGVRVVERLEGGAVPLGHRVDAAHHHGDRVRGDAVGGLTAHGDLHSDTVGL